MFNHICVVLFLTAWANAVKYNICSLNTDCWTFNATYADAEAVCIKAATRMDCAKMLIQGNADIAYLSADELLMLKENSPTVSEKVKVIASSAPNNAKNDEFEYQMVAVVRASTKHITDLKDAAYCKQFIEFNKVSPRLYNAFERKIPVVAKINTTSTKTVDQLEVEALNNFFGFGCRPGTWSADDKVDTTLKRDNPKLCSLCQTPASCDDHKVSATADVDPSLSCLETNSNDDGTKKAVAYVDWEQVKIWIKNKPADFVSKFNLLCTDDNVIQLTSSMLSPPPNCVFVKQPWGAIVANGPKAADISKAVKNWWETMTVVTWKTKLFEIITNKVNVKPKFETKEVIKYTESMLDPVTTSSDKKQSWCVETDKEMQECDLTKSAITALGLRPAIACDKIQNCIEKVKNGTADFVASQLFVESKKKYELEAVKLVDKVKPDVRIVAIVTNKTKFKDLESVKDKRACFPEIGSHAHYTFLQEAINLKLLDQTVCKLDDEKFYKLFNATCIPGEKKACSLCKTADGKNEPSCAQNDTNKYYGNKGALKCLEDSTADVAFVDINEVSTLPENAAVLCRNGEPKILDRSTSPSNIVIDKECVLAHIIYNQMIFTRSNNKAEITAHLDYYGSASQKLSTLIDYKFFENLKEPLSDVMSDLEAKRLPECPAIKPTTTTPKPESKGDASRSVYSLITIVTLSVFALFL